jgi:cephalosporin hydroxylase
MLAHCDDRLTDKNTVHSYVEVYESLFSAKRETARTVLEIGIGPYMPNGGSLLMWAGYFQQAEIHGVDIIPMEKVNPVLVPHPRIHLHTANNAYDQAFFVNTFLSKGKRFDILVDDGPHTLESMVTFVRLYSQIMKDDGILVVEDVQAIEWCDTLRANTPDALRPFVRVIDRRAVKGRWDDILFVIDCSQSR